MNGGQEVTYAFNLRPAKAKPVIIGDSSPRIARLMALAIRFEGLVREKKIRDYAELARRGRVTRARMTQIHEVARSRAGYPGTNPLSASNQGP
jgi:hypothetical protein